MRIKLIDAEELLKELESNKLQPTKDTDGFIDGWCEGFNTVVDMIRNQPTAFDAEKVVAELEELHKKCENCPKFEKVFRQVAFEESIDIVKKGGVK